VGLRDVIGRPFAFLFTRSQKEELIAEYVVREHHKGRALSEILEDAYVTNRLTPEQVDRLLDRPELIQAIGGDLVVAQKSGLPPPDAAPAEPAAGSASNDPPERDPPTSALPG
jgi:hypothetical protein